jgi:hypothetical protein
MGQDVGLYNDLACWYSNKIEVVNRYTGTCSNSTGLSNEIHCICKWECVCHKLGQWSATDDYVAVINLF